MVSTLIEGRRTSYNDRMTEAKLAIDLADGTQLYLRPIQLGDAVYFIDIFHHLSSNSRYQRFLRPVDYASAEEVSETAEQMVNDTIRNGHGVLAFNADGVAVGGARYFFLEDGTSAEFAISIRDDMQRKGMGSRLMAALVDMAQQDKLQTLIGIALAENHGVQGLLNRTGLPLTQENAGPEVTYYLHLQGKPTALG